MILCASSMLTGCLKYETKEVTIEVKNLLNCAQPHEQEENKEKKYEVIDVELSFKSVAKTYPYYEMHQDVFLEPK